MSRFVYEHVVNACPFVYHEFDLTGRLDLFSHLIITRTKAKFKAIFTSKAIFCLCINRGTDFFRETKRIICPTKIG